MLFVYADDNSRIDKNDEILQELEHILTIYTMIVVSCNTPNMLHSNKSKEGGQNSRQPQWRGYEHP